MPDGKLTNSVAEEYPDVAEMFIRDLDPTSIMGQECSANNSGGKIHQDPEKIVSRSKHYVGFRCQGEQRHEFVRRLNGIVARLEDGSEKERQVCPFCDNEKPSGYYGATGQPNHKSTEPLSAIFVATNPVGSSLLASHVITAV
jgi:hypothetical protein